MKTLVIMSGAYVEPALVAEFGLVPPSFLPLKGRPLYERQIELARGRSERVIMVLPEGFNLTEYDVGRLRDMKIQIVLSPAKEGLGASVARALAACDTPEDDGESSQVDILLGDTVISLPENNIKSDFLVSGSTEQLGNWTACEFSEAGLTFRHDVFDRNHIVVAGLFSFSSRKLFRQALERNANDFYEGISDYSKQIPIASIFAANWFDFGHVSSYYRSRSRSMNTRAFNTASVVGNVVHKTGEPKRKIYAEAQWFKNIPDQIKVHTPHLISISTDNSCSYSLEYIHLPLISDIYCFGRLRHATWGVILESCISFLSECYAIRPKLHELPINYESIFYESMIKNKTMSRVETFCASGPLNLDNPIRFNGVMLPSLKIIIETLESIIAETRQQDLCLWHGDFHFGNIFYDFRSNRIKVIDPRGMLPDGHTAMFGDVRYDMAKLSHSVVGFYDYLLVDAYDVTLKGDHDLTFDFPVVERFAPLLSEFKDMKLGGYRFGDLQIQALCALLFLSMVPLHHEAPRRQLAMLANGLRIAQGLRIFG